MNISERMKQLADQVLEHRRRYYILDQPTISDVEYDALERELRKLEADYPLLADPNSPTNRVGVSPLEHFNKVAHDVPMLSLDNTYSVEEINAWVNRIQKNLTPDATPTYSADLKIDGLSLALHYKNHVLVRAITRGDGATGEDVTENAKTIADIPLELPNSAPSNIEVRGEVFLSRKRWQELNAQRDANGEQRFANPRNAASGTMKLLDSREVGKRKLQFIPWQMMGSDDHGISMQTLFTWGFTKTPAREEGGIDEILAFIEKQRTARQTLPFDTDGIVIKVQQISYQKALGATDRAPRWAIAFKYPATQEKSTLLGVTWQVGRSGKLTPVAELEPVEIAGSTVRRATLHNVRELTKHKLTIGCQVFLEKGGDVIPKVISVIPGSINENSKDIEIPLCCPDCGKPIRKEYEKVRRVGCSDSLCKLSDFSSMSTCPCCENKIINKLSGAVRRYYCSNQTCEVSNINRLGNCPICKAKLIKQEKNSDVLTNIYCINTVCFGVLKSRLYHFASRNALNIEGFGEAIIDQFINTRQINNPWDIYKITENKADGLNFIISLEGMAEISANNLMDALINSKTKPFWQWIHALGIPNIGAVESQSLAKAFVNIHVLWKVGQCKYAIRSLEDIGEATEESLRTFINENNDLPIILDNWGILPSNEFTSLPYKFDLLKWIKKLSIAGLVETTLEKITSDYSTPEKLWILASNQSDFEIQRTKMGVDSKVAERLLRFCQTNLSLPEYMKLIRFADTSEYTQNLVLAGKTMVITGTLSKYSRAQSSKLLESLGAKIVGSVTKKTSCLLVGEAPGLNKIESAKKHGTQIVNELWLDDLLSQQQGVQ